MKVMSISGTRPEIIKQSRIYAKLDENFDHVMVFTNQNYTPELSDIFFSDLGVRKPDYNLKINTDGFGSEVADIISKTEQVMIKEKPDVLVLLGDVNSGLSAISAAHLGIKIVHLEAGMRSYDKRMPEEKNRVLIDHIATVNLPYIQYCRENLIRENIHPASIYVVGNPIFEVINYYLPKIEASTILKKLKLDSNEFVLVTAHRSENVDNPKTLKNILQGLDQINKQLGKRIIYPMHPRTKSKLKKKDIPKSIEIIKPLGFFDFSKLEQNAFCYVTDSGTLPEDALIYKKPCVIIRESSERPEFIEAGCNILSGLDPKNIVESVKTITSAVIDWKWDNSLGDGKTSSKVVNIIKGKLIRIPSKF
ncbi:UDP-N-acetylglucosamine 2-epimerase (non-hydrolyzing) [Nitrosopumilus cobalaminigenes]|uniref:UDP-N-acetylglucosamine 2-epimerase (Non-hydrolyzing) n=1 Tax=Nitrosopumilus cobalaminigenes TaxID=1470066 RepID=A0A7D5R6M7_9ARCH|nr:UDP-N-acetylglucosamine 2-epimerase (non-hydrolyzing) [Nitrosopumilus cobalaminigenes]QLH02203.1 UDP-N-acetylglucosamine 2-epimerase (non-hydrolyzing) [Nitrosopumilus cobalaminigenes]